MPRQMLAALTVLAALCLAGCGAQGQRQKAQVTVGTHVTITSGDEEFKAYLAVPGEANTTVKAKGPFPGIVLIHDEGGLDDWMEQCAGRLAVHGFVVIAPDLYRGKKTDDPKVAAQWMASLSKDRALRDLKATVDKLAAMDSVHKDKIGCVGWGMGGTYSLQAALNDKRILSCAICCGAVPADAEQLKPLNASVLGIFGADDKDIKLADVRAFHLALIATDKSIPKFKIYKGAGHSFMRPRSGKAPNPEYNEAAAREAREQIETFFINTLQKK
jgi:carboxymethylenebutenolidase